MIAPENNGNPLGDNIRRRDLKDTRLIARAIKQRWNIPEDKRDALVQRQIETALDPETGNRESTSATKCILEMERQNQADAPAQHLHLHADVESLTDAELTRIANSASGSEDSTG